MKLRLRYLYLTLTILLLSQQVDAGCWWIFGDCNTSTSPSQGPTQPTSAGASNTLLPPLTTGLTSSASSPLSSSSSPLVSPSSSSLLPPSSSSSINKPSSSATPSSSPTSFSSSAPSSSSLTSSSTSATSSSASSNEGGGTNTGAIVGSVCGFLAVLGLGFGYAFFSKARRNQRNRKAALYNEEFNSPSNYHDASATSPYYDHHRASPAMAQAAVAAADDLNYANTTTNHYPQQQQQQQQQQQAGVWHDPYHSTSPTVTQYQHNQYQPDYYTSPPLPHATTVNMGYPDAGISGAYYSPSPAPAATPATAPTANYYDHNYYNTNGNASFVAQPAPAVSSNTHVPMYSAPNAYDDHDTQHKQQKYQ